MRTEWLISVTLTMFFSTGTAWGYHAAPTGNEEAVCSRPEVLMCDNFEDRATGGGDWAKHTYKNNGWAMSNTVCTTVSTASRYDGTKALRFDYLAVLAGVPSGNACRGNDQGGAGFMSSLFSNVRTIYARWYSYYSANWVASPIAEKHSIFLRGSTTNGDSHMFARAFGNQLAPWFSGFSGTNRLSGVGQNINGTQAYALGSYQCFEVRITANSTATATDGYIQGWINDVQHWEYPGMSSWGSGTPTTLLNNIELSSYWNCLGSIGGTTGCHSDPRNAHPDMQRYIDRVVISTARIGCSGTPTLAPPAAPGPLNVR